MINIIGGTFENYLAIRIANLFKWNLKTYSINRG